MKDSRLFSFIMDFERQYIYRFLLLLAANKISGSTNIPAVPIFAAAVLHPLPPEFCPDPGFVTDSLLLT